MQLFYAPDIDERIHILDEEESKHLIRVLRMTQGDVVFLTDGKGNFYEAQISKPDPKRCEVSIVKKSEEHERRDYYLHIGIAPTKNVKRFEWFLEKATEIGVDEITPIICEHSERKHLRQDRLINVLIAAMKQSVKAYLPALNEPVKIEDFFQQSMDGFNGIAVCDNQRKPHLKNLCAGHRNITILIGPEGDFSYEEIQTAISEGYKAVSLGSSRLRTETAGVVACSIVNMVNDP
ncbi:MAG: 16S rRNA (uracil(1498)-N(3))-methyltransferase [Bacteroidales bacterium]